MEYEYLSEDIRNLLSSVDAQILWQNQNQSPRRFEMYHPSAFGQCLRLMQYQRYEERGLIKGEHKPPSADLCRIWGNGHDVHDRWRSYFESLHILRGYWQCSNPFCGFWNNNGELVSNDFNSIYINEKEWYKKRRVYGKDNLIGCFKPEKCICGSKKFKYEEVDVIDHELNFHGHADIVLDFSFLDKDKHKEVLDILKFTTLPEKPIVVDMKSINHFYYQDVAKGNPHKYYLIQLMIYINILKCDYGVLIYENKNNQKSCAFKVLPCSETFYPIIRKQALTMNDMLNAVDETGQNLYLLPPPRPADKADDECTRCRFQNICHSSDIWDRKDLDEIKREFYGELL